MQEIQLVNHEQLNHYHLIFTHSNKKSIYLGDLVAATNLNFIHSQNITTVITAALGMDQIDYSDLHINHVKYPFIDNKRQNISQFFDDFYDIIERNIKIGNIFVHCSAGISRSPTLMTAYLMKKLKWSFKHAVEYVQFKRKQVIITGGCERQLKVYERIIRDKINIGMQRKKYCFTGEKKLVKNPLQLSGKLPNLNLISLAKVEQSIQKFIYQQKFNKLNKISKQIRRNSFLHFSSPQTDYPEFNFSHSKNNSMLQFGQGDCNNFQIIKIPLHQRFIPRVKKYSTLFPKKV